MPYIAKKLCRFDKEYLTGDIIPDEVILSSRVRDLIEMGAIAEATRNVMENIAEQFADALKSVTLPEEDTQEESDDRIEPPQDMSQEDPQDDEKPDDIVVERPKTKRRGKTNAQEDT